MLYLIPLVLQGYCIYHCIKHGNQYYWLLVIFFLPLIGSIIYLITQVYNQRDADTITKNITNIINPTKKIKDLEGQLELADTYQNRVDLADAYLQLGNYENAINNYKAALDGNFQNDLYVIKQMVEAFYKLNDFESVVTYAEKIGAHSEFNTSRTQFLYGLALKALGKLEDAEQNLSAIDIRFSHYNERVVYAKFLIEIGKTSNAKDVLEELLKEGKHMTKPNKKLYKSALVESEQLLSTI